MSSPEFSLQNSKTFYTGAVYVPINSTGVKGLAVLKGELGANMCPITPMQMGLVVVGGIYTG